MNTKTIIGIIALAIIVGGGAWYATSKKGQTDALMQKEGEAMMQKEDAMMEQDDAMMQKADEVMEKDVMEKDAMMEKSDDAMQKDDAMMAMEKGGYMPYDASKLAFAEKGKVVLFFHASWCPTCIALDKDIRANVANIPADVLILDVDYDSAKELRQKYAVTTQHTLVQVDAAGDEVTKWVGSQNLTALLGEVK